MLIKLISINLSKTIIIAPFTVVNSYIVNYLTFYLFTKINNIWVIFLNNLTRIFYKLSYILYYENNQKKFIYKEYKPLRHFCLNGSRNI